VFDCPTTCLNHISLSIQEETGGKNDKPTGKGKKSHCPKSLCKTFSKKQQEKRKRYLQNGGLPNP
jgi:hypothetical protein